MAYHALLTLHTWKHYIYRGDSEAVNHAHYDSDKALPVVPIYCTLRDASIGRVDRTEGTSEVC